MDEAGIRIRKILLRARWSAEDAKTIFAAWEESKLPAMAFARKHGFDVQRLYWWRRRLGGPSTRVDLRGDFEEIVIEPNRGETPESGPGLEIKLPRGVAICVSASFDEETLRRLLKVLREEGEC